MRIVLQVTLRWWIEYNSPHSPLNSLTSDTDLLSQADHHPPCLTDLNNDDNNNDNNNGNEQDLGPPSSFSRSLPVTQDGLPSVSITSVEEWIDRTFTHSTSKAPSSSTVSRNTTFTSLKRKRDSFVDCDELIEPKVLIPLNRKNLQTRSEAMALPNTFHTPKKGGAEDFSNTP